MSEEKEFIQSNDGLRLSLRHWPVADPEYVLCIVHGLGEHGGRYHALAQFLNEKRIAVVAADLRGHGHSEGKRGHARSLDHLLSDIEEMLKYARAEYTESKLFLFGHSLGGNLVTNFVSTQNVSELAGFIASAPFFKPAYDPPAWKVNLGKMITSVWPSLTLGTELDAQAISREDEVVKAYKHDPLVHDQISAKLYDEIIKSGERLLAGQTALKLPGLMYHGTADRLTSIDCSRSFAENHRDQLTWKVLEGVFHEPHNDLGKEEVYSLLFQFISSN